MEGIKAAISNGLLGVVRRLIANELLDSDPELEDYCLDESLTALAAETGHLEILKLLRFHGCPWNEHTPANAARKGHLHILQYAHAHGCPWNESTPACAAQKGHLPLLQYAHTHRCPWNARTTTHAAYYGHIKCFDYAIEHGCDVDIDGFIISYTSSSLFRHTPLLCKRYPLFIEFITLDTLSLYHTQIDLDEYFWRELLFEQDLNPHQELANLVVQKKKQIEITKEHIISTLQNYIGQDISKYIIGPYI